MKRKQAPKSTTGRVRTTVRLRADLKEWLEARARNDGTTVALELERSILLAQKYPWLTDRIGLES